MHILKNLIDMSLNEDVGSGDITSNAIISKKLIAKATITAKQDMVMAGLDIARAVFLRVDKKIKFVSKVKDGNLVKKGTVLAEAFGPARSLVTAERTALNFIQRLSGIATLTRKFVLKVSLKGVRRLSRVLDTRKTTPGWRMLEKYAVKMGGGTNHRFGLFDMCLIKNNHIDIAGSVTKAVQKVMGSELWVRGLKIEVEVRNFAELEEALRSCVDIIMLDNFSVKDAKKAVGIVKQFKGRKPKLEISGNINLKTIGQYAKIGADYISAGSITHSAPVVDINMTLKLIPRIPLTLDKAG